MWREDIREVGALPSFKAKLQKSWLQNFPFLVLWSLGGPFPATPRPPTLLSSDTPHQRQPLETFSQEPGGRRNAVAWGLEERRSVGKG
jgi:hypothetical protein